MKASNSCRIIWYYAIMLCFGTQKVQPQTPIDELTSGGSEIISIYNLWADPGIRRRARGGGGPGVRHE